MASILVDSEVPPRLDLPPSRGRGALGTSCRLLTNCFKISLAPQGKIYHYHYTVTPRSRSAEEERWVLQQSWERLCSLTKGTFVVRCPSHLFSTVGFEQESKWSTPADQSKGYPEHEVQIELHETYAADDVENGVAGDAEVVLHHVVKKLAQQLSIQKVGRRYFSNQEMVEAKNSLKVFAGFHAAVHSLSQRPPLLQLESMHRLLSKRNVLETIALSNSEMDLIKTDLPEVQTEWRKRCLFVTVSTSYNLRVYQIKAVRFDMTPTSTFRMFRREDKTHHEISFEKFYEVYYSREIVEKQQPLLEAIPEKETEQVFLVPELCLFTGFNDEIRKDKQLNPDAIKQCKINPPERLGYLREKAGQMMQGAELMDTKDPQGWKVKISKDPEEVQARTYDALEVCFADKTKKYPIEDGNFSRWMRNGLQCPTRLDDWLFIYPEADVPVLDIWLRSLRDIAQVAFAMRLADPVRHICTDQVKELAKLLEEKLTPRTQMVLLLTPQKDHKQVYQIFKQTTITKFPCLTQVVRSETIRRRQAIAQVLSRIVLQVNAKFCGPLWHIALDCDATTPAFKQPTMVIGIDVFTAYEGTGAGKQYVGIVASTDTHCAEYYSTAAPLEKGREHESLSLKLQEAVRDAILRFSNRNHKLLPQHFLVYRASVAQHEWYLIYDTEVEALQNLFRQIPVQDRERGEPYNPTLTYVAITRKVLTRFFLPEASGASVKNPEPGTVIDTLGRSDLFSFYLINQAGSQSKGTVHPTQYTVLYDTSGIAPDALQNLTYRLSYLYFNYPGSVRIPAPAQYAKKIAHLIGTAVHAEPHKRLRGTFFYL